ncbi:hypothetical protein SAMN05216357_1255 [Porphyromonadaceae bacterium KH3CP3RA]|nr:hypothetical protein SAMN05216357_1255 [Porphyromonadaceae bacterium KH3CP3RA]
MQNISGLEQIYTKIGEVGNTLLSLFRIILLSRRVKPFSLPVYNNNKELVVLGNGPSLRLLLSERSSFLEGKDLMMVNFSASSDDFARFRPMFYLLMDPAFFEDEATRQKLFVPMVDRTVWEMHLFVPVSARKYAAWQEIVSRSPYIRIHWFNATPVEGVVSFRHFCYRKRLGMPRPRNVLVACLMVALQLPYDTIYLAGADHSWMKEIWVDENNIVNEDRAHFYDRNSTQRVVSSHRLHELLDSMAVAFRSYHEVEAYSRKRGKEIINITPGSFIDAFRRMSVD